VIDAKRLDEIFKDCLFTDEEMATMKPEQVSGVATIVEGVISKFGFMPERLEKHRAEIESIVEKLPDIFWSDRGGGASFLQACIDRFGHHWGEHRNVEQLMALGTAIGRIELPLPRELWSSLPGEMPYLIVKERTPMASDVTIGDNSVVIGKDGIKIGNAALDVGDTVDCIAVGRGAQVKGKKAIAVGPFAVAEGNGATAFGYRAQAIGDGATAVGDEACAIGTGASQTPSWFTPAHIQAFRKLLQQMFRQDA
jgi:hypothetical protein